METRDDLRTRVRAALLAGTGRPSLATAREIAAVVGGDGLDLLGEFSVDRRLATHQRVVILLAIAMVLATAPDSVFPERVLDAIETDELASAAIRTGHGAALTGILAAAPRSGSLATTRTLIGRQLLAAGERGPHVAQLLLDAGDRQRGIEILGEDLALRCRHEAVGPELWALLTLLLAWSDDEPLFEAILRQAASSRAETLTVLLALLPELPGADPQRVARARSMLVWLSRTGSF